MTLSMQEEQVSYFVFVPKCTFCYYKEFAKMNSGSPSTGSGASGSGNSSSSASKINSSSQMIWFS